MFRHLRSSTTILMNMKNVAISSFILEPEIMPFKLSIILTQLEHHLLPAGSGIFQLDYGAVIVFCSNISCFQLEVQLEWVPVTKVSRASIFMGIVSGCSATRVSFWSDLPTSMNSSFHSDPALCSNVGYFNCWTLFSQFTSYMIYPFSDGCRH